MSKEEIENIIREFEWAYVDDVMMLMEKMMRFNNCKNEDQ